jgi:hypothetical protein
MHVWISFVAAALSIPVSVSAEEQTITLNLTAQTQAGEPIGNAPFEAASTVAAQFAMTDAGGQATFTISAAENEETLMVRMSHGGFSLIVPPELRDDAIDRFHALRKTYSFKPYYLVPIDGDSISFTVTPDDAVTISGRLVDGDGNPIEGVVGTRGRVSFDFVLESEAGVFALKGVAKGLPAEIWFGIDKQLHSITLTAAQTAQDTNIGDVTVVDTPADGSATILMQNTESLQQPNKTRLDLMLSLVAVDDAEVHGFDVKSDGRAYWTNDASEPVYTFQVPAGTYFVTPGSIGDQPFFALLESVRAGRQAQLILANVPMITISADRTTEFTFDAQAARDAIIAVGGDLVEE